MKVLLWDFHDTLGYRLGGWLGAMCEAVNIRYPEDKCTIDDFRPYISEGFPWHTPNIEHPEWNNKPELWWGMLYQRVFYKAFTSLGYSNATELSKLARSEFININNWTLYDDVLPVLSELKELGWIHVIVSNHIPELKEIINQLSIGNLIEDVINSADVGYEKPNPKIFEYALQKYRGEHVWMIGDNVIADIKGAEKSGIKGILIRKSDDSIDLKFKDLFELKDFLCNSMKP